MQDQYLEALLTGGVALLHLEEIEEALSTIQQACDLAQLAGDQPRRSIALSCLALCNIAQNRPVQAISLGKEALSTALRSAAVRAEILAQRALSEAYLRSENPAEATFHIEQGLSTALNMRLLAPQSQFWNLTAKTLFEVNELDAAAIAGAKALKIADDLQIRPAQIESRLTLARISLEAGDSEAALKHSSIAVHLGVSLGIDFYQWRGKAIFAQSALLTGQKSEAKKAFIEAIAELDRLRMRRRENSREKTETLLEEWNARELWQNWLMFLFKTEGAEAARKQAAAADWPPLMDWLETQISEKGGTPNA